jgi:hypothetical protein
MKFIATLVLTFLVLTVVVAVLTRVRTPWYRLGRENVIRLLEMVLDGTATAKDWHVFVSMPIRCDPELETIRVRCLTIEEKDFIGKFTGQNKHHHLFTKAGLQELGHILEEIKSREREESAKPEHY